MSLFIMSDNHVKDCTSPIIFFCKSDCVILIVRIFGWTRLLSMLKNAIRETGGYEADEEVD